MKERILLFTIFFGLGVFLYVFQSYFNTVWGLAFLCAGMTVYAGISTLAYSIKKRNLQKHPAPVNKNYKPFVTVMVPGHNEQSVIAQTIENILALDYENFEVIVIDDRSTDNTSAVIRELEKKYEKVTAMVRVQDAFPGKSAVLNDAMELAKGEAILVFDADARVKPDFLSILVPYLEPKDVGAVQARKIISNKEVNFLTRCQSNEYTTDSNFQICRDSVKGAVELRGNGELIKRTALEDIGGWNNYTITDDLDMSTRLHIKGWDVRFCLDTAVYEEAVIYLWPLYRQRRRWLEGTFRRYLEHAGEALRSKDMSLRVKVDMFAYIAQFIMPMWLMMEFIIRGFKVVAHQASPHTLYSSIILGAVIGAGFFAATRYSLRRYDNMGKRQAIKEALETSVYMLALWFPLVIFICLKILFRPKDMNWGKTTHGLVREEEEHLASKIVAQTRRLTRKLTKELAQRVIDKVKEEIKL